MARGMDVRSLEDLLFVSHRTQHILTLLGGALIIAFTRMESPA